MALGLLLINILIGIIALAMVLRFLHSAASINRLSASTGGAPRR
jgi:hypothetical protein